MTLHIPTRDLVDLLGDLILTASDNGLATDGVLLHTARGYATPDSPGRSTLLAGTSTDTRRAGHTWCAADGDLDPVLWPAENVRAVLAVYKPLSKHDGHEVQLSVSAGEVTVTEGAHLFGDGQSMSFAAGDLTKYPRGIWSVLRGPAQGEIAVQPRTDIRHARLEPYVKIGRRRGEPLQLYHHQGSVLLVQIGDRYRGYAAVEKWDHDQGGHLGPSTDLYPPTLPDPAEEGATA